jgi:hypothetical protein
MDFLRKVKRKFRTYRKRKKKIDGEIVKKV